MKQIVFLTNLVYEKFGIVYTALCNKGYENVNWIDNPLSNTQALLCTKEDELYIVFRGLEFTNIRDWFTNLDCLLTPCGSWGNVHRGFYKDAESVFIDVLDYTQKYDNARSVNICGHGQGAGVATVMAMLLAEQRRFGNATVMATLLAKQRRFDKLIIVGSPRVCDAEAAENFGRAYGPRTHRIVNNNDIVTRVPPRAMGFKHIENANLHYFKPHGSYITKISAWEQFKDRVNGNVRDIGKWGSDGISDHKPGKYVSLVESI